MVTGMLLLAAVSVATIAFFKRSRLKGQHFREQSSNTGRSNGTTANSTRACSNDDNDDHDALQGISAASNDESGDSSKSRAIDESSGGGSSGSGSGSSSSSGNVPRGDARQPPEHVEIDKADQERQEKEELHELLQASPRAWENPLVQGFNKMRARTTLGAFSSVDQAR